ITPSVSCWETWRWEVIRASRRGRTRSLVGLRDETSWVGREHFARREVVMRLGAARDCRWPCDLHPASEPCVPHPVGAPHWPAPERAGQEAHQSERRADQLFNFLKSQSSRRI